MAECWLSNESGRESLYQNLPNSLRVLITFLIVVVGWVFFRASNLTRAVDYLASMLASSRPAKSALVSGIYLSILLSALNRRRRWWSGGAQTHGMDANA